MRILYRPSFYEDLEAGVQDLAEKASARVATRWADAVQRTIARLPMHPGLGRRRADLTPPGARSLSVDDFPRYLIFYVWHESEQTVEIVRILYGMMDLPRHLPPR